MLSYQIFHVSWEAYSLSCALRCETFVSFIQVGAQCASRSDVQTFIALRCGVDPENTKFKQIVEGPEAS